MKLKFKILIALILSAILLSSCQVGDTSNMLPTPSFGINQGNEKEKALARMEEVLLAIKEKDSKALFEMFSQKAIDESDNFAAKVADLFEFFKGDIVSWEQVVWGSSENVEYGKLSLKIRSWYTIFTDENEYTILLIDFNPDTLNKNNEGLYTLRVLKTEDEDKYFTYWEDIELPGIWVPEKVTPE
jgi:hypothetical protein